MLETSLIVNQSDQRAETAPPVFVSFSYKDLDWKNRIVALLRDRGLDVWEDSRLQTGDDWNVAIHQAIDGARAALLLISPDYLASRAIQGEQIPYLLAHRTPLFPILIEPCEWQSVDWLAGIQIFPPDLQPLSSASGPDLDARLAAASLELCSLAGIVSTPQRVSAWLFDDPFGANSGMATLLSPDRALAVMSDQEEQSWFTLTFSGMQPATAKARIDFVDRERNLSLLRLTTPLPWDVPSYLSPPLPGAVWECMSFTSPTAPGVFTTGTVLGKATRDGREYLHLQPSIEAHRPRGMKGAPIVVEGRVVAILESQGAILDEWFAIALEPGSLGTIASILAYGPYGDAPPSSAVAATLEPVSPATPAIPFDPKSFLSRLSPAAAASLKRAEAYRLALGQKRLHMEHLLLGLYEQQDSPIRKLAREARVFDEAGFRRLLASRNARLAGDLQLSPSATLPTLLEISDHVRQALIGAQQRGGGQIGRRSLLEGALSVDCSMVSALLNAIPAEKRQGNSLTSIAQQDWLPQVSSDVPGREDKDDLLNITRDVNALCSVIAAADAALPLSIGLFGEWGSGKSFFMNLMEARLKQLQGAPAYCANIKQLKFNAWHYMDTSLWASLTSEIFEGLATELSTSHAPPPENKVAELLADVSTSRDKLAAAERQRATAETQLAESEARLEQLAASEAEVRASLSPRLLLAEATRLAFQQDEVKEEFDKAAKVLNLPQAGAAGAEVDKELLALQGTWSAMLLAMRNTERLWIWLLASACVVAALWGLPPLVRHYWPAAGGSALRSLVAEATALLGGTAALLTPFLVSAKRALRYLQDARKKSDELVRRKQEENRAALEIEHKARQAEKDKQDKKVEEARDKLQRLQQSIEQLRADRQMLDFIKQRNASTDYSSHLGVIARAHKDFRELSAFLEKVVKQEHQPGLPPIDRIVLYVDDLDRCPEDKVMDVLQAVHLLLAFPLFVVVVGVDPRWLLHSVAERSPALRREHRESAETSQLWHSTPLNYLEKIFQIPFTLSPMTATGFGELVEKVAGSRQASAPAASEAATAQAAHVTRVVAEPPPATKQANTPGEMGAIDALPHAPTGPAPTGPAAAVSTTPSTTSGSAPSTIGSIGAAGNAAEPLRIEPWERDHMKQLHSLIPSPRAGKRFVNIYRMIRSTVEGAQIQAFVGDREGAGDHRHTLLLLAILTGYPDQAAEIMRRLIEREHNETWWEFIDSVQIGSDGWAELRLKLQSLRTFIGEAEGCDVFRQYAPSVARYSFQSGRVLLAQQLPQSDN